MRQTGWLSWVRVRAARRTYASRCFKRRSWRETSAVAESLEARCLLTAGDLDPSFGAGGKVTTDFGAASAQSATVALQSDGKIVVAGTTFDSTFAFTVARYNADGTLDSTFDGDGVATTRFGDARGFATSVVIQADGKIVVAGGIADSSSVDFGLVRYNDDGSLDTAFGTGGVVRTSFGTSQCRIGGMALQSDGKIVVAGYLDTNIGSDNYAFALARYAADGSLDSSFDGDGRLITDFGPGIDIAYSVGLGANGQIVAAGFTSNGSNEDVALVRYNDDGTLDASFDQDGKLTINLGITSDRARGVVVQSDDKIVVVGSSDEFVLTRFNNDGTLDTSFDSDGVLMTDFGIPAATATSLVLQANGKLVAAGGSDAQFAVARYITDGSLDPSFGASGKLLTDFETLDAIAKSVVVQTDGNIVVVGIVVTDNFGHGDFALARYIGDPNEPPVFNSASAVSVPENTTAIQTVVATDPEHGTLSYSLDDGADSALFDINANSGALSFISAPDFERPADTDHDNVYLVTVQVSDGTNVATQDVQVTVTNVGFPIFVSLPKSGGIETAILIDGELHVRRSPKSPDLIDPISLEDVNVVVLRGSDRDDRFTLDGSLSAFDGTIQFDGGDGNDSLNAANVRVLIQFNGDDGNDTLLGGSANDRAYGGAGNDSLSGGDGDDFLWGGDGNDSLTGGAGNDSLYGITDNDVLDGGNGDDYLDAGDGNDNLIGGDGNDLMAARRGNDRLRGDAGNDTLFGEEGNDLLNGGAGNNTLVGEGGNDTLIAGSGDDDMFAGTGNDLLNGGAGNNTLIGEAGNDTLASGTGDDIVFGGDGEDSLNAGAGDNTLIGEGGNDTLIANTGNDVFYGGTGNDSMAGGDGNDTMFGEAGSDTINGGMGNDVIDGGDDNDNLQGSDGNDAIRGGNGNDMLNGGKGNDLLTGSAGDDRLYGMSGNDTLLGDSGDDALVGSSGNDTLNPGPNTDHDTISDGTAFIDTSFTFNFDALLAGV